MELQEHTILETDKKKKRKNLTLKEELCQDGKTSLMLKVEQKTGQDIRAFLKHSYVAEGLSWIKIAALAGVSIKSVREWGTQFGIKSRSKSKAMKLFTKEHYREANKYTHLSCCICQKCKAVSSRCGFESRHKEGYCVFGCVNYEAYKTP